MNMLAAAAPLARLTRIQLGSFARAACRRERLTARLFSPPAAAHARWVATADAPPPPRPSTPPKAGTQRLDELTIARYPEFSRTVVQSWIAQGKVLVDGQPVTKAGTKVKSTVVVDIIAEQPKFVCRGGLKLEKALDHFEIDVDGLVCLDSGLSTGGFTDCMLQRGAAKVYGVDVGYGQVAEKIRVHPKAVVMERTNLRYLQPLPDPIDVAALDLSFISVLKVLPAVAATMRNDGSGKLIVLIKPQFEARRSQIGAKGVVRDPAVHEEVIANVVEGAKALGFVYQSHTVSPIKGAKEGNTEFLAYFTRDETHVPPPPEKPSPS
jgi:23S rRNA (cytidine1920-2'-O)/16S rRNA (cytidine1409-2'-O)-methyltransferase